MDSNIDYKELARRIRSRRAYLDLTAEEVEKRGGPVASHLSRIERGHVEPDMDTIERIAKALRTSVKALVNPKEVDSDVVPE